MALKCWHKLCVKLPGLVLETPFAQPVLTEQSGSHKDQSCCNQSLTKDPAQGKHYPALHTIGKTLSVQWRFADWILNIWYTVDHRSTSKLQYSCVAKERKHVMCQMLLCSCKTPGREKNQRSPTADGTHTSALFTAPAQLHVFSFTKLEAFGEQG